MPKKSVIKKSALAPTILIAGGAGFVGSHLAEALLLRDAKVVVLDNFKTGKESYVDHLLENPKFALFDADINVGIPAEVESVDYIFHLASLESYLYGNEINLDSLLTNALGTKNLLDLAVRSKAKFLLASSVDIYQGMVSQVDLKDYFGKSPQDEKQFSQAEAKRFAEALVWEYYKRGGTDVRIVRLPEIYGPRMSFDSCSELGRLLKELTEGKNLNVYGEGVEKQHYLYISSAVSGIVKALFNENTNGKIYPLVDKEPYSQLEIVYLLKSLANHEIQVNFKETSRETSPEVRIHDTSNLTELGWEPKVSFKEGILKTLTWAGYDTNEKTFKPSKLIEDHEKDKANSKLETTQKPDELFTLADVVVDKPAVPTSPAVSLPTPAEPQQQQVRVDFGFRSVPERKPFIRLPKPQLSLPALPFIGIRTQFMVSIMLSLIFSAFIIFIGLPGFQLYSNAKAAVSELKLVPMYLGRFDSSLSKENSYQAFQHFNNVQASLEASKWMFVIFNKNELYQSASDLFSSLTYFSKSAYNFSKALMPVSSIWDVLKPNSEKTLTQEDFSKSLLDLNTAQNNLQLAQAKAAGLKVETLPESLRDNARTYISSLDLISKTLKDVLAIYMDLPDLLGINGTKRYLILFQNSNEIRPTGGFIGSYAVLELNKGKIQNLTIDDIYNPDGQIKLRNIKVPLPQVLADYLGEDRLYIRNANWNPDFPQSVSDIKDLFFKVDGQKFDGVIALDLHFSEALLRVTGPVFLTAYNEEINADNMYERAQFHSDFNYQDGSPQKKSFLTVLGSKLLERLLTLQPDKLNDLVSNVHGALEQKHLLVYIDNNPISLLFKKYGWDGSIDEVGGDYLEVVNANVGGTKANYFMKNSMKYEVSSKTRDGLLRSELNLIYEHTGKDNSWPDGPYKNYVRVIVPKDSKLTAAHVITNEAIDEDVFKKVTSGTINNYQYFAIPITVQPTEKVRIYLGYDLPGGLTITMENKNYTLTWQKQSGTEGDKVEYIFNPPFGLTMNSVSDNLVEKNGSVGFTGVLKTNMDFSVGMK